MPETSDHASAATTEPTRLDPSQGSHLDTLYRAAIGPMHADYYLPILMRFEAYGRASPSWNWAAFGITLNWMLFRGLWLAAVVYLAALAAAALTLAAGMALAEPPLPASVQWSLWAALLTMALLVPGFFGNAWLHRVYRNRLDRALARTTSLNDACMLLARQSSSRPRLPAIALGNLALAALVAIGSWPSELHVRMWPRVSGDIAGVASPASATAPPMAPSSEAATPTAALEAASPIAVPEPAPATAASPEAATPLEAPAPVAAAPATAPAPATAAASAPVIDKASTPPTAQPGRYLINVGLFAQQDNALRAHATLQAAGLPALSESLQTRNGQRTRVRVGPFATRAQADAAAEQIRSLQLEAVVIRP